MSDLTRAPKGAYLIESAPNYRKYLAAKAAREIVEKILTPVVLPSLILAAAISGYREKMDHMLAADPIYLGPGR